MNRTVASLLAAVVGAILWLVWNFEHEETSIRAPWTGLTLAASAAGFMAAGIAGRGSRAVLAAVAAALGALGLVDPLVWQNDESWLSDPPERCDPGCITLPAAVVMTGAVSGGLAALGILLRRAVALVVRGRASTAS
jgi:hypothetical protein